MSAVTAWSTGGTGPVVSAHARELAVRLSALFEADSRIARRLNDAQRRLQAANDRLWSGLHPDALGLIYDGVAPAGQGQIAKLVKDAIGAGGGEAQSTVLQALQDVHWQVHGGFCEYQSACEERRQLAVEVGELAAGLTDALCAVGWTRQEAQRADVHQLAASPRRTGNHPGAQR
ncbi:MAG TPA: hypothetical protein VKV27_09865 [Solirubrobacteraceae bacterium]|nr:hypothetical protein [Solirubrobacteraceae bacterium]